LLTPPKFRRSATWSSVDSLLEFKLFLAQVATSKYIVTEKIFKRNCTNKCSSFAGWSSLNNSLVVDISHINSVSVSKDKKSATVGGGIRLGALYTSLNVYGLTFHGGICPTVGLGGYVGVGGKLYPLQIQRHVLTCIVYRLQHSRTTIRNGS
jgi:hypothetical protein